MKKITVFLVSLIYVTAIIVVSVLGILGEVHNETIEVASIVLEEARSLAPGRILTYPEGSNVEESDYAIFSRPDDSGEGQDSYEITWDIGGVSFDYVIQLRGYKKIMDSESWKDGQGHFSIASFVLPENATKRDLSYSVWEDDGRRSEDIAVSPSGLIEFQTKRSGVFSFDARVEATDMSFKVCNIHIIAVGY